MTFRPDNTHYLRAAEQAHHADLTARALDAMRALTAASQPVNFSTVAHAAGCSRSFLNRHPTLAEEIRRLRPATTNRPARTNAMTETSAKARVEQLRAENGRLRADNSRLRAQVAALLEQLRSTTNTQPAEPDRRSPVRVVACADASDGGGSSNPPTQTAD